MAFADLQAITANPHFEPRFPLWVGLRTFSFSATPAVVFLSTLGAEVLYDLMADPYGHSNLLDDGNLSAEKPKQHRLLKTEIEALRVGTSSAGRYTVQQ